MQEQKIPPSRLHTIVKMFFLLSALYVGSIIAVWMGLYKHTAGGVENAAEVLGPPYLLAWIVVVVITLIKPDTDWLGIFRKGKIGNDKELTF